MPSQVLKPLNPFLRVCEFPCIQGLAPFQAYVESDPHCLNPKE